MTLLVVFVALAIIVSFYCSLLESAFLSITPASVQVYLKEHPKKGAKLVQLKEEVDRPLAAILSLNTIAHTLGATGAGAQAAILFGNQWIAIFSALLTLAILILSEVIPKTLGAVHWRRLIGFVVNTLPLLIALTYPLVWLSVAISSLLRHRKPRQIMRSEIHAIAELGEQEGAISKEESAFIQSLLKFKDITVDEVMTPISVVASVQESEKVEQVLDQDIPFSRIPLYRNESNQITGYILKDDLHELVEDNETAVPVAAFKRSIFSMDSRSDLPHAINYFSKNRDHIAVATDKSGQAVGIITLEDAVETLLGWEIVDEFDPVPDMRKLAKNID
ncbi:MAG: DUF21 domain-containing protein [Acidiferrobacterales bacterium]|nr:DUF21 domain-containing protein [Acidiferrobacterales bacterium]